MKFQEIIKSSYADGILQDDAPVAYDDNGNVILADRLQKWAHRILSAYPEMLEGYKRILTPKSKPIDYEGEYHRIIEIAKWAIAKAEIL